ncbi:quinoprotein dehydrogenase-associated SoxYZ-like carrier [Ideonella sp.]|uniref:quinoprotein dehydrogenase-associated SoxYZ-like carrier n=1 Tax=Ideonella sp. TaxID=1929293 RepID=UPI002B48E711|nr:quinoprotein dehydrogenase-associated SoxYZ-like carrier [Ideonella sp.]HJV72101.1 quinoprotein dehydrogenase-associated SoxYZ-like carrier [Ideonella sp.]
MIASKRRWLARMAGLAVAGLLAAGSAQAQLKSADNPEANPVWQKLRAALFADRPIKAGADEVVQLDAPTRAEDAAVVPIAVRTRLPPSATRRVDKLYLIIDNNPTPLAAVFQFTPQSGQADIETRVRVDEYTHVRAIAETNDGQLYMTTRFVKASGGCSAPPGKDAQAALASLGKMRLRVDGDVTRNKPVLAQLMISHPNNSGLAMDQSTRQYTPAHFVRKLDISYAGKPVLSAELDFAISENPNFRFWFVPTGEGELKAEVVDSKDLRFESALTLRPSN